jgi:acyl-CoA thioester hydrolase
MTFFPTIVRVPWADTDAARVVWFGNFLKYLEAAEVALFDTLGRPLSTLLDEHGVLMPRTSLTCRYRSPARFDDVLEVGLAVENLTERRIHYVFEIRQRDSRDLVVEGSYNVACVDASTFTGRAFPDLVRGLLSTAMSA